MFFYMHHLTDRIAHTTAFVTLVVGHWLEREIAQWVHHEGSIRRPIASCANALTTKISWKTTYFLVCTFTEQHIPRYFTYQSQRLAEKQKTGGIRLYWSTEEDRNVLINDALNTFYFRLYCIEWPRRIDRSIWAPQASNRTMERHSSGRCNQWTCVSGVLRTWSFHGTVEAYLCVYALHTLFNKLPYIPRTSRKLETAGQLAEWNN